VIVLSVFLFGCAGKPAGGVNEKTGEESTGPVVSDYFPIMQNVRLTYEGTGNEYASYIVTVDYTAEGKVQQRIDNGGTVTARVLSLEGGKLVRKLSRGEAYYRENLLDKTDASEEVLLMEPIETGTSWTLSDGSVRKINDVSADVTTPSGNYKAVEVTTEGQNGSTADYYVKDIGFIKSVFTSEGSQVTSSLGKIEENISTVQKVRFFYPNINDNKLYYRDQDVSFKTNEDTKDILASVYRQVVNNAQVISENTKINSLYLGDDNIVNIDFNDAFQTEMNAGSGYESMILTCIANTFGWYYNSDKVILTVQNKPYESGHIAFKEGEFIKTDFDNAVEIK